MEQPEQPKSAFVEIVLERLRQDEKWGGPAHDDEHSLDEWAGFIEQRAARVRDGHLHLADPRKELIEIGALAVAAIESIDRQAGRRRS